MGEMKEVLVVSGDKIWWACERLVKEAPAFMVFNGTRVEAVLGDTAAAVENRWRVLRGEAKSSRHPAIRAVLQFFDYAHLPQDLQAVSKSFSDLAEKVADGPQNAEATVALRKLLEAKDAAVRAYRFKDDV